MFDTTNTWPSDLAARLRSTLRGRAKTAADVRRLFREFDSNGDGVVSAAEFDVALHRLGLGGLPASDRATLLAALDSVRPLCTTTAAVTSVVLLRY
jgi:EF hand